MNYYNLKEKLKSRVRIVQNESFLMNNILSMFDYTGIDFNLKNAIETYLRIDGMCGIKKIDNELRAFAVIGCAKMLNDGNYSYYNLYSIFNSEHYNKQIENKDFILIKNMYDCNNDFDNIQRYASMLKDVDVAQVLCINGTKIQRLLQCSNTTVKAQIDNALTNCTDGKEITFVNDDEFFNSDDGVKSIDLYNSNQVALIQYLTTFRENVIKRLANIYGMTTFNSTKQAQQTNDEINSGNTITMIIPLVQLECRKIAIEKLNNLYGLDISVKFSKCWEKEYNKIFIEKEEKENEKND